MPDHKFTVIWSPEADFDLLEIWRWGAKHFSSEIADAHAQDILRLTANLQDAPLLGRSRDDLLGGIRSVVVYPTVVFYRVATDTVEIVRVVDGRKNLAAIFARENSNGQ